MRWGIELRDVEVKMCVGIHPHEREPQRVLVNVKAEAEYGDQPASVSECFDYDLVYRHVTQTWPARPHTELLETLVVDLLAHLFAYAPSVQTAAVSVAKPDAFAQAERVAVSAAWTRHEFEAWRVTSGRSA